MTTANMQPLRDLLATYPEECAAVFAVLASGTGASLGVVLDALEIADDAIEHDVAVSMLSAGVDAGIIERGRDGLAWIYGLAWRDRYAIARMGAAAWLREKCPRTDKHRRFDLSNARLHEIAAEAMRSAVSEDDRAVAYKVRAVADGAVPFAAIDYRGCLTAMVKRGARLDVDAEVAAVWGETVKEGGEQR